MATGSFLTVEQFERAEKLGNGAPAARTTDYFNQNDIVRMKTDLTSHTKNGKNVSEQVQYAHLTRGKDIGAPVGQAMQPIFTRTTGPKSAYEYGQDRQPLAKIGGPWRLAAPRMIDAEKHRDVWTGWRPRRIATTYEQLGMKMPVAERGQKFETKVPTEEQIFRDAHRMPEGPYPMVPPEYMIPDPYRELYTYVEGGTMLSLADVSGLGLLGNPGAVAFKFLIKSAGTGKPVPNAIVKVWYNDTVAGQRVIGTGTTDAAGAAVVSGEAPASASSSMVYQFTAGAEGYFPMSGSASRNTTSVDLKPYDKSAVAGTITDVSQGIADVLKAKYGADIAKYQTQRAGALGIPTYPGDPSYTGEGVPAAAEFPWGTVATVGLIGVAALFVLPKVLR